MNSARRGALTLGALGGLVGGVALAVPSVVAGCSDATVAPTADAGTVDASVPEVRIGLSLGLSNGLSGIAEGIQNAARLTETFINDNGGVLDMRVRFVVEDDASSTGDDLRKLMTRFVTTDQVSAIFGPLGSGQVVASHPFLKERKTVQISPSATSLDLATGQVFGGADRYFFRTVPNDSFQGKAVARFAYDGPSGASAPDGGVAGCRRLALIYNSDPYGKTLASVIKAEFQKREGAQVVYEKQVPTNAEEFRASNPGALVAAEASLPGGPPECQAIVLYYDGAGIFLKEWEKRRASFPERFFTVGTDGIYSLSLLEASRTNPRDPASANAAKGIYGTNPDTNPRGRPEFESFRARYTLRYPLPTGTTDIPSFAANTFDALLLVSLAIQQAGTTTDGQKIRDALVAVSRPPGRAYGADAFASALVAARAGTDIDYQGASGNVDFNDEGWTEAGFIVWKVTQAAGAAPVFETQESFTAAQLQ